MHTTGKGRKERTTPLTRQTAHTLRAWMPEAGAIPSGPVFPTRRQTSMSADAVQRLVAKHAATAAISCPSIAARPDADCNEPEVVPGKQSREDERANKAKGANAEPTQSINRCAGHRALPNFSGAQALLVMRLVTAGIWLVQVRLFFPWPLHRPPSSKTSTQSWSPPAFLPGVLNGAAAGRKDPSVGSNHCAVAPAFSFV